MESCGEHSAAHVGPESTGELQEGAQGLIFVKLSNDNVRILYRKKLEKQAQCLFISMKCNFRAFHILSYVFL